MTPAPSSSRHPRGSAAGPRALLGLVAAASLTAAGCGLSAFAAKPDPTRFFVLAAAPATAPAGALDPSRTLGLGPIDIPSYLQRPELVVRESATEIRPSSFDRWSESLDKGIARVLAQDLSTRLGLDRVTPYPWYATQEPTYQVRIDLRSFEATAKGEIQLSARWDVKRLGGDGPRIQRDSVLAPRAAGTDTREIVAALSAALGQLADEIATAVATLDAGHR
ncbi:MAG: PqiC family protein [bacterium]